MLTGLRQWLWPYTSRRIIAKIANKVHERDIGDMLTSFSVGPALLSPNSVPVLESVDPEIY
jgi:hypothetical protein